MNRLVANLNCLDYGVINDETRTRSSILLLITQVIDSSIFIHEVAFLMIIINMLYCRYCHSRNVYLVSLYSFSLPCIYILSVSMHRVALSSEMHYDKKQ